MRKIRYSDEPSAGVSTGRGLAACIGIASPFNRVTGLGWRYWSQPNYFTLHTGCHPCGFHCCRDNTLINNQRFSIFPRSCRCVRRNPICIAIKISQAPRIDIRFRHSHFPTRSNRNGIPQLRLARIVLIGGDRNRRQNTDDRDNDHQLDQGKTLLSHVSEFRIHGEPPDNVCPLAIFFRTRRAPASLQGRSPQRIEPAMGRAPAATSTREL